MSDIVGSHFSMRTRGHLLLSLLELADIKSRVTRDHLHANANSADEPTDHQHGIVHGRGLKGRADDEDADRNDDRVLAGDLFGHPALVERACTRIIRIAQLNEILHTHR